MLATLDWAERPELFVTQTPVANAMAVGFDKPFIVVNTGALELLDDGRAARRARRTKSATS